MLPDAVRSDVHIAVRLPSEVLLVLEVVPNTYVI